MGAAWLYGKSFLRRRWMLFVVLGIVGGFAGGVVIASWGGARRTQSAIERFDRVTHAPHVVGPIATADQADVWLRIAALPQVEVATRLIGLALMSQQDFADETFTFWGVVDTDAPGESIGRPVLLRGRRANDNAPEEVALPESLAEHWHLDVGNTLSLMSWIDGKFLSDVQADEYAANGPTIPLRIVGITRNVGDIEGGNVFVVPLSAAFARAHPDIDLFGQLGFYRLRGGLSSAPAFINAARAIATPADSPDDETSFELVDLRGNVGDALDTAERGEIAFAIIGGLATLLMMAIVIGRAVRHGDDVVLASIGMSRSALVVAAVVPVLPAAALAFVVASFVAHFGSRASMVALAQRTDPALGAKFDGWLWISAAAFALSLLLMACVSVGLRRHDRTGPLRSSMHVPVGRAWQLLGLSLTRTGRRGGAGAARAATIGVGVAVVGFVAGAIYVRNLDALAHDRARWGLAADFTADGVDIASDAPLDVTSPLVDAASLLHYGFTSIDGEPVHTVAFEPITGSMEPEVLAGQPPAGVDEIALGSAFFDRGVHLGSTISVVDVHGVSVELRVVGEVVAPPLDGRGTLSSAAIVSPEAFAALHVEQTSTTTAVRNLTGHSSADTVAALGVDVHNVFTVPRPAAISNIASIRTVAERLVALLGFLGLTGALIALAGALRSGRKNVAIGRALGMASATIRAALVAFASVVIAHGVAASSLVGAVAGIALWRAQSDSLGVRVVTVVPWTVLLAGVAIGGAGLALLSTIIGDHLGRARSSNELRIE